MKANRKIDVWRYVDKRDANDCWPWIGSTFSGRYGRFFCNGRATLAHRQVFELVHGTIDDEFFVMHKCNNKLCCNPKHLVQGRNSENQRHASVSGAWPVGKTGIRGVGFIDDRGYWTARAYLNGKSLNLYTGPHKDKAVSARHKWESEYGIKFEELLL